MMDGICNNTARNGSLVFRFVSLDIDVLFIRVFHRGPGKVFTADGLRVVLSGLSGLEFINMAWIFW